MVSDFGSFIFSKLHEPRRILILVGGAALAALILQGDLLQYWRLKSEVMRLRTEISELALSTGQMKEKNRKARDPAFIEREARDRLDMLGEDDIEFVFSDEAEK